MIYFREIEMSSVGPPDPQRFHRLYSRVATVQVATISAKRWFDTSEHPHKKGSKWVHSATKPSNFGGHYFSALPKAIVGEYWLIYAYNAYICLHILIYI